MRDKEAIENERKNLVRNLEKQAKVVERLRASEGSLREQLVRHPIHFAEIFQLNRLQNTRDQSVQVMQESLDLHVSTIQALVTEKADLETRSKADQRKAEDVRPSTTMCTQLLTSFFPKLGSKWTEQVKLAEKYKSEVSRLEGALAKKMSELVRQSKARSAPTSVKEAQLQGEVDKCMSLLKCSTCRLNLRTTVLTKCMHSEFFTF